MNSFLYRNIDYHIMAYKSRTGEIPNAILLPFFIFEELTKDVERKCLKYMTKCVGDDRVYSFDIIVTMDSKEIQPIRILKSN